MAVVEFVDDDKGFFDWMKKNQSGYFVNTPRKIAVNYMVLHRSGCQHTKGTPRPGNEYTKAYRKVCAAAVEELHEWAKNNGRPDGSFSKICKSCSLGTLEPSNHDLILLPSNYLPSKEDIESADWQLRKSHDETIGIDAVLNQVESNIKMSGKLLKHDWREVTKQSVLIWFGANTRKI